MLSKKEIAEKRIRTLFSLAEKELKKGNEERVKKYIFLARKIGMKCQYTIPKEFKRMFCKKCSMLLIPKISCSKEFDEKTETVVIKCFYCNSIKRYQDDDKNRGKHKENSRKAKKG